MANDLMNKHTGLNELEDSGSPSNIPASYEQIVSPAKVFLGVGPQLRPGRYERIANEYYALTRALLEVPRLEITLEKYCYQILGFIRRFAQIEKKELPETALTFLLIDLADYCNGLPLHSRIVGTLERTYQNYRSPRAKIALAECVGRLWMGLPQAAPMFFELLSCGDSATTKRVNEAVERTLNVQIRLINQAADRSQELNGFLIETTRAIDKFRKAFLMPVSPVPSDLLSSFRSALRAPRVSAEKAASMDPEELEYGYQATLVWDEVGGLRGFLGASPVITEIVAELRTARFQFLGRDTPITAMKSLASVLGLIAEAENLDESLVDRIVEAFEQGGIDTLAQDALRRDTHA